MELLPNAALGLHVVRSISDPPDELLVRRSRTGRAGRRHLRRPRPHL